MYKNSDEIMLLRLIKRVFALLLPLVLLTSCGGVEWFTFEDEEDLSSYDKRRAPRDNSFILEGGLSKKAKYRNAPIKKIQKSSNQRMRNPNASKYSNNTPKNTMDYRSKPAAKTQAPAVQESENMDDFFENLSVAPQARNGHGRGKVVSTNYERRSPKITSGVGRYLNNKPMKTAYASRELQRQYTSSYEGVPPEAAITYVKPHVKSRQPRVHKPGFFVRSVRSVKNAVGSLFGSSKKTKPEGYEKIDYRIPKVTVEG
jgi:hypothetical protein